MLNIDAIKQQTFDAIVVGSGITGGWAAKELTEKGLKVLMLERGREIKHIADYQTAMTDVWDFQHRNKISQETLHDYATACRSNAYAVQEASKALFESDEQHPYIEDRPFDWVRGYHTGGKSLMWGRHSYRWSKDDFEANGKDGTGVDWPIRYDDLAPWYSYVEKFVGVSGRKENYAPLPDGEFLPPMPFYAPEQYFREQMQQKMGRLVTIGRTANLTEAQSQHIAVGRTACQYRYLCIRGCPYGGYFSTQSATLPAAMKTNRLTLLHHSIVSEVIFDPIKNLAKGVRVINELTHEVTEYYAKVIFLNAGTIPTTSILMNSISSRFANGLGNDSDQLGRNLMDHNGGAGAMASIEGFEDDYMYGRRPTSLYVPRFRNVGNDQQGYLRGFGYQGAASRANWTRGINMNGLGGDFKDQLATPGGWGIMLIGIGEMLPYQHNRMTLDPEKKDAWGMPLVRFEVKRGENELKMRKAMTDDMAEMYDVAGFKNIRKFDFPSNPGAGIHEMGTARMGKDPKTSVLNAHNQLHTCKNVFVTDGSAMASSSCVNPSLTYMALTARAADYAVKALTRKEL